MPNTEGTVGSRREHGEDTQREAGYWWDSVAVVLKGRSRDEKRKLIQRDAEFEMKSNGQKKLGMIQAKDPM